MFRDGELYILVMRERWVLVGRAFRAEDALFVRLESCAIVRRWGTAAGLGQLAREGPLAETILDPEPDGVLVNKLDIMRMIPCSGKWGEP